MAEAVARETGWDLEADWAIGPVGRHRDSDALAESNFSVALEAMGGESDDVAIAHFRHWAVGWVEEIGFRMGSDAARTAYDLAERLEDYPVLDEEDYSRREWEEDHPEGDDTCYSEYCAQDGECSTGRELSA